jgi:hypothetical protein
MKKKKIKNTRVFIEEKQVFEVEKGNVGPAPHVYTN